MGTTNSKRDSNSTRLTRSLFILILLILIRLIKIGSRLSHVPSLLPVQSSRVLGSDVLVQLLDELCVDVLSSLLLRHGLENGEEKFPEVVGVLTLRKLGVLAAHFAFSGSV